ncbi:MAG: 6-carboxytetrahydropterin synthase [Dehalococcoidia bacterium]|nr:6-carboxytetrahydropterin synthase [Dehalococcoidia bacterium]
MPRYQVTKLIDFCYGHRLLEHKGKCRYLHGHNGLLEVDIAADALNDQGMVLDFGDVRDAVKSWVDANLDHRMLLCRRDPTVPLLQGLGEPMYLMDENPTAENVAKHIFQAVRKQGVKVSEIRLWETPNSYAVYREP